MGRASMLASALFLLCAAPSPVQERPARAGEVESALAAALERVRSPSDLAREVGFIAGLGSAALEPLFGRLVSAADGPALGVTTSAAVLGALCRLPREDLLAFLTRLARGARNDRQRQTGLDLLGRIGGRGELKLAIELGTPTDPSFPPEANLSAALRSALLGICERERGTARTLAGFFPRALPAAQAAIAAVVARAGGDEAAGLLAGLLVGQLGGAGAEADALLLLELSGLAGHGASEDLIVLERVRGILGHPDADLATLACLALAKLRDHAAVPDLIVLLSDDDPNPRRAAHAALTSLTGLTLPAEEQPWIAWLAESFAWWDERAESCRVALVSGSAAEAAAAVHETAEQRLFVDQVVEILALALGRPEPDLVASACRALGAIPERAAHEALAPLVAHPDPAVAERARAALRRHERARPLAVPPSLARIPARSRLP